MINVQVERGEAENSISLVRRFTRRIKGSGILMRVRSSRFRKRPTSKTMQRKSTLRSIQKRESFQKLIKLGKIPEKPVRRR